MDFVMVNLQSNAENLDDVRIIINGDNLWFFMTFPFLNA